MAVVFAAAILIAALVFFALQLGDNQADSRAEIEKRFDERPQITASLTESLFTATTSTSGEEQTAQFGGADVTDADLTKASEEDQNVFSALYDDAGELIAVSEGVSPEVEEELSSDPPYVQAVLDDQPIALSDLLDLGPGNEGITVFATPVEAETGEQRVLVNGLPPVLLATFLGQYLAEVPNVKGGESYLLDSNGAVVASSGKAVAPGEQVDHPGLLDALEGGDSGEFGDEYFASSPVENTPWVVVSTAPADELFEPVQGANKWTPWLIFAAFALAAVAALWLLRRAARTAAELADAHGRLEVTNQALERRARELEQSNAELDQFASIASHDLQEPLRKVQMFSEKVADSESDTLSDQGRDYLMRSSEAAGRMQLLIQDLLEFSRVATRARPMVKADLGALAREVVSDLEGAIEESGGTVEIGDLPTTAVDPAQIRRMFQNLISNGLKFSREGVPPEVRVEGTERGRFVEIRVTDNGIGFDPKYANRIFRVFERLHGRGDYPGTGIGLALARKIAERHGGTVAADSTLGQGSTFTVTLLKEDEGAATAAPVASGSPGETEDEDG